MSTRLKLGSICTAIFLTSLIYYGALSLSFPPLFNVDNYENYAATRYLAEHVSIPVVDSSNEEIYFTELGTTRLLRPPFTFIVSAAVFRATTWFSDDEITRLRLGSPIIAAFTLVVIFLGFYVAFSSVGLAFLGASAIALLPRFVFLATCNNDDIGAIFSVSVLFSAVLALRRYGARFWPLVLVAGAIGFVLQTKYTAWLVLPWFFAYLVILLKQEWRRVLRLLPALLLVLIASGGWWPIFNMVHYGVNDPSALGHASQLQAELGSLEAYRGYRTLGVGIVDMLGNYDGFLNKSYRSLVGYLEWIKLDVGTAAYLLYGGMLIVGFSSVIFISREQLRRRAYLECFIVLIVVSQCFFFLHHNLVRDVQPQGRYILPTMTLGIYLFLRAIKLVPNSFLNFRVGSREYGTRAIVVASMVTLIMFMHLNVMSNIVRPAYASQAYFSKLEPSVDYALDTILDLSSTKSVNAVKSDTGVEISRVARDLASISLTDKFCKMLPINALISLEVSSGSVGSLTFRFNSENSRVFDDVYWQSFTAGTSWVNFSLSKTHCGDAKLSLGKNTHLITIHSLKIAELKVHKYGKPI